MLNIYKVYDWIR